MMPASEPLVFSEVRRKLLVKFNGPEDAAGLYARAVRAYRYGLYQESLDLAWVAVKLDDGDARFWQAKALAERALGQDAAAEVSAQRAVALNTPTRRDPLAGMARVTLNLPADARLFVGGQAFPLPANQRTFTTPALEPGKKHFYEMKAELVRDGLVQTETRKVYVEPGQHVLVDFKELTEVRTAGR
jgi:uncharacterized protein (TIGR03000 family)